MLLFLARVKSNMSVFAVHVMCFALVALIDLVYSLYSPEGDVGIL